MTSDVGLAVITVAYDGRRLRTTRLIPVEAHAMGLTPVTRRSDVTVSGLGGGAEDWRYIESGIAFAARELGHEFAGAWGGSIELFSTDILVLDDVRGGAAGTA